MIPAMASPGHESEPKRVFEAQLRVTLDVIPAYTWYTNPSGGLTFVNERLSDYLGLPKDHPLRLGIEIGASWDSHIPLLHPDDREEARRVWSTCLSTGHAGEMSFRVRNAEGGYRWFLTRSEPLRASDGTILYWIGVNLEIDELKQAEFYLSEGQRLAHMGSWAFNPTGFEYWSSELFRIYGLDPRGSPPTVEEYLALVHPEDREFVAHEIQKLLAHQSAFEFTKRIVRPDGEIRRVRCVGIPTASTGTAQRFVGTGLDVTEQEELTDELRRSGFYLSEGQRLAQIGSWGFNPAGFFDYWSVELFRIYGLDPDKGPPTLEQYLACLHPQDRASMAETIRKMVTAGLGCDLIKRIVRPAASLLLPLDRSLEGELRYIRCVGIPIIENGVLKRIIGTAMDVTEQEQLTQELQRREAYLTEAQRLSRTGSFGWRPDTGEIVWSDETYRIFEYDPAEKPTISMVLQRTHPEDRALVQQIIENVSKSGTDFKQEYRLLLPDGRVKHVLAIAHAAQNVSGDREFVGAVTDITERKTADEALRSSEGYLAEAQMMSQTGSWAWSPATGGPSYWSEECYRVLGFDPTDGLPQGEDFFLRIHPDDRPGFRELAETSIREKAEFEADYRVVHTDGRVRDIHVIAHPVLSTSGELVEFVGTVIDVTERKRAEEELRRSEMELRQMVDFTPQLVAVYGPNRERLYANHAMLDYAALRLEEWRRRFKFGENLHPDDWELATDHFDRAVSNRTGFESELRLRKGDGSYRWFLARGNPVFDDKGQIMRWYVALTDIDKRKKAEEKVQQENVALREEIDKASMFEEIVGTSPALKAVLSRISKVAPSDSTVLITGETGTGKELIARAIHRRSDRRSRAFVSLNCAAIPRELIASELFGHEKGAFTGATQQRLGRFELASGGTLFLDEVGELPAETQIALLRVLQEHEFERVGGTRPIRADVRVITATNRDLQAAISAGSFRRDLFYRLNVFPIEIPALRERKEDIRLLVEYFIDRYARKAGKNITSVDKKTLRLLESYPWPGNIRELQNVIERSVIVCETETFLVDESWLLRQPPATEPKSHLELSQSLAAHEKEMIEVALRESGGRVFGPSGAAAKLGMPRSTLESKIRSLKINKNRFKA
jgi:PAS domain S-box-containing protein